MKISYDWLNQYCRTSLAPEALGERLLLAGFPVESITPAGDDVVLDVEVTSNRPDLLGHLGMAREVSALTGSPFSPPKPALQADPGLAKKTSVAIDSPANCPFYSARIIEGVKVGPSPTWLVRRLEAVGLRPVNNVVDITNFVLFEYSQPLHAFDFDKLHGRRIIVRQGRKGEKIVSIDGHVRELDESMLVIADADQPVAVAGVMGGLDTEVGETTRTILLESAYFAPLSVRSTARKLALFSDSSYRFERGVDLGGVVEASNRATDLIVDICGGNALPGLAVGGSIAPPAVEVSLRPARLAELLGIEIPAPRAAEILARLGLAPRLDGQRITVTVPSFRQDITREVDLVEEVARVHGYGAIPVRDRIETIVRPPSAVQQAIGKVSAAMVGLGFYETVSFTFVPGDSAELFARGRPGRLQTVHPSRRQESALRRSLLPSLLSARRANQNAQVSRTDLFEIANVFDPPADEDGLPDEPLRLGLCTDGGFTECRNAVEQLVAAVDPHVSVSIVPADRPEFAPGQAGNVLLDGAPVGLIGLACDAVRARFELAAPVMLAELDMAPLIELAGRPRTFQPVSRFPAVERDLCVFLPERTPWSQVESAVRQSSPPDLESITLLDLFRGKHVPPAQKSLTFRLRYRSQSSTLTGEQADRFLSKSLHALESQFGAVQRK